jgi:hypothetical protein
VVRGLKHKVVAVWIRRQFSRYAIVISAPIFLAFEDIKCATIHSENCNLLESSTSTENIHEYLTLCQKKKKSQNHLKFIMRYEYNV